MMNISRRTYYVSCGISILFLIIIYPAAGEELRGVGYISFFATSTLHDFSGTGKSEPFIIRIEKNDKGKNIIRRIRIDVPVKGITTEKAKRDKEMREMFRGDQFPLIHGEAVEIHPDRRREELTVKSKGKTPLSILLTIRDVTREIKASVSNLDEYGEQIIFDMEFTISLKDFHLEAPSMFLGLVRVGDRVEVKVSFYLKGKRNQLFPGIPSRNKGERDAGMAPAY